MLTPRTLVAALASGLALAVGTVPAAAQPAPTPAPTEADRLFDEGRVLMDQGKYPEACAKFEESIAKDPRAVGTLINLGMCNARAGKVATAVKLLQEAHDRAAEAGLERTKARALEEIAKLVGSVPVLVLRRAAPPLPGEKLVIDDEVYPPTSKEIPLDPGGHTVVVTAPGRLPFEHPVALDAAEREVLDIPTLAVPTSTTVTHRQSGRRVAGKVAVLGGGLLVLAGGSMGLFARTRYDNLFDDPDGGGPGAAHCGRFPAIDGKPACDAYGQDQAERDRNLATAGTIIGLVGVTAVATGLVLWLTASDGETQTSVTPVVTPTSASVMLQVPL